MAIDATSYKLNNQQQDALKVLCNSANIQNIMLNMIELNNEQNQGISKIWTFIKMSLNAIFFLLMHPIAAYELIKLGSDALSEIEKQVVVLEDESVKSFIKNNKDAISAISSIFLDLSNDQKIVIKDGTAAVLTFLSDDTNYQAFVGIIKNAVKEGKVKNIAMINQNQGINKKILADAVADFIALIGKAQNKPIQEFLTNKQDNIGAAISLFIEKSPNFKYLFNGIENNNQMTSNLAASLGNLLSDATATQKLSDIIKHLGTNNPNIMQITEKSLKVLSENAEISDFCKIHGKNIAKVLDNTVNNQESLKATLESYAIDIELIKHSSAFISNIKETYILMHNLNNGGLFAWTGQGLNIINQDLDLKLYIQEHPESITNFAKKLYQILPGLQEAMKKFDCDPAILEMITPALNDVEQANEFLRNLNAGNLQNVVQIGLPLLAANNKLTNSIQDNSQHLYKMSSKILSMPTALIPLCQLQKHCATEGVHNEVFRMLNVIEPNIATAQNADFLIPLISHMARRHKYCKEHKEELEKKNINDGNIIGEDLGLLYQLNTAPYLELLNTYMTNEKIDDSAIKIPAISDMDQEKLKRYGKAQLFIRYIEEKFLGNDELMTKLATYNKHLEEKLGQILSPTQNILKEIFGNAASVEEINSVLAPPNQQNVQHDSISQHTIQEMLNLGSAFLKHTESFKQDFQDQAQNIADVIKLFAGDNATLGLFPPVEIIKIVFSNPEKFSNLLAKIGPVVIAYQNDDHNQLMHSINALTSIIRDDQELNNLVKSLLSKIPMIKTLSSSLSIDSVYDAFILEPNEFSSIIQKMSIQSKKADGIHPMFLTSMIQPILLETPLRNLTTTLLKNTVSNLLFGESLKIDQSNYTNISTELMKDNVAPRDIKDAICTATNKISMAALSYIVFSEIQDALDIKNLKISNITIYDSTLPQNSKFKDVHLDNLTFYKSILNDTILEGSKDKKNRIKFTNACELNNIILQNISDISFSSNTKINGMTLQNCELSTLIRDDEFYKHEIDNITINNSSITPNVLKNLSDIIENSIDIKDATAHQYKVTLDNIRLQGEFQSYDFSNMLLKNSTLSLAENIKLDLTNAELDNIKIKPEILKNAKGLRSAKFNNIQDLNGNLIDIREIQIQQDKICLEAFEQYIKNKFMPSNQEPDPQQNLTQESFYEEPAGAQSNIDIIQSVIGKIKELPDVQKSRLIKAIDDNYSYSKDQLDTATNISDWNYWDQKIYGQPKIDPGKFYIDSILKAVQKLIEDPAITSNNDDPIDEKIDYALINAMNIAEIGQKLEEHLFSTLKTKEYSIKAQLHLIETLHKCKVLIQSKDLETLYSYISAAYDEIIKSGTLFSKALYIDPKDLNNELYQRVTNIVSLHAKSPELLQSSNQFTDTIAEQLFGKTKDSTKKSEANKIKNHILQILSSYKDLNVNQLSIQSDDALNTAINAEYDNIMRYSVLYGTYINQTDLNNELSQRVTNILSLHASSPKLLQFSNILTDKIAEQLFGSAKDSTKKSEKNMIRNHMISVLMNPQVHDNICNKIKEVDDATLKTTAEKIVGKILKSWTLFNRAGYGGLAELYYNNTKSTKLGLGHLKLNEKLPDDFLQQIQNKILPNISFAEAVKTQPPEQNIHR